MFYIVMNDYFNSFMNFLEPLLSTLANNIVVSLFIVVIMVLTILAFMSLMRIYWFYKREQWQLNKLENKLKQLEQQPIETIDELQNKLLLYFQKSTHTLVYERINFVLTMAKNRKLERIQAAAESMPPKKLTQQQSYFANFVISVLLIVGLAGTLWAFEDILMNSGLSGAIQENKINIEKYTPAIGNIYEGLKSAMSASLAGILGTIFLLFIKFNWIQPVQERFFSHLDWITEIYLIPICSQFEKHQQLEQTLVNVTGKLNEVIGYTHNLAEKLKTFTENTDDIVKRFDNATNKESSFYQASTRLSHAVEAMEWNYNNVTNRIDELVTAHNKSVSRYETYLTKLDETQKGFTHSQEKLVAAISAIPKEFRQLVDGYTDILGINRNYINESKGLTESIKTQQTNYTVHVKEAAESMIASLKGVNQATEKLEAFTTTFSQKAESLIPELAKLGVDPLLHQYVEQLKNSLISTQNEFMQIIQQQQEAMLKEFNQIDSLKQIEQSVKEMQELLNERHKSWVASLFKRD